MLGQLLAIFGSGAGMFIFADDGLDNYDQNEIQDKPDKVICFSGKI